MSENTCGAVRLGNKLFMSVKPINFNATVLQAVGILATSCSSTSLPVNCDSYARINPVLPPTAIMCKKNCNTSTISNSENSSGISGPAARSFQTIITSNPVGNTVHVSLPVIIIPQRYWELLTLTISPIWWKEL